MSDLVLVVRVQSAESYRQHVFIGQVTTKEKSYAGVPIPPVKLIAQPRRCQRAFCQGVEVTAQKRADSFVELHPLASLFRGELSAERMPPEAELSCEAVPRPVVVREVGREVQQSSGQKQIAAKARTLVTLDIPPSIGYLMPVNRHGSMN